MSYQAIALGGSSGSGSGEMNEYSFKTLSATGQTDIIADNTTDTLILSAMGSLEIFHHANTDTVILSGSYVIPPEISFRALREHSQSIPHDTNTVVQLSSVQINISNGFDTTTNRFTPGYPGRYLLNAGIRFDDLQTNRQARISIRKNGTIIAEENTVTYTGNTDPFMDVTCLVDSTQYDYFDVIAYHDHDPNTTRDIFGGASATYFGGYYVPGGDSQLAFRAHRNNTVQNIPNDAATQVQLGNTDFNIGDKFNASTYRFTPGIAGRYLLNAGAAFDDITLGQTASVYIRKNGTTVVAEGTVTFPGLSDPLVDTTVIVDSDIDDYFDIAVYQDHGSTRNITGLTTNTYFEGYSIQGGTSETSFHAHRNGVSQAIASGTATVALFDNVDFNIAGKFSTSNGRFTPVAAGRYILIAGARFDDVITGASADIYITKNGTTVVAEGTVTYSGNNNPHLDATCIVEADTDDYFDVRVYHNHGSSRNLLGTATDTYFQGHGIAATGGGSGWYDDGSVVRLITSTDKVGIGTASPSEKLTVAGNISTSGSLSATGNNHYFTGVVGIGRPYVHAGGTVPLQTYRDGDSIVGFTCTTGNFSTIDFGDTDNNKGGRVAQEGSSGAEAAQGTHPYSTLISNRSESSLHLGVDCGIEVTVLSSGQVGIGTTAPSDKLDVNGNLTVGGNQVTINTVQYTWPSSDGSSGYQLTTDSSGNLSWAPAQGVGGGEANEFSFKTISVAGQTAVVADTTTDTLTLVGGSNVAITTTAGSDTVTFAATDTNTTYDVMGSGNSYAAGLVLAGSSTHGSAFLRKDGSWQVPTNTSYTAGAGLDLAGTVFSHEDTSSQASVDGSGRAYIQDITLDTYGHVTGLTAATETVTDTTYTAGAGLDLAGTVFSHEDTSSQASSDNSGRTYIQDVLLDTYGHVTGLTTATAAGGGTVTTVKLNDTQVGGADIVTLDFSIPGFSVTESPDTEVNIALDLASFGEDTIAAGDYLVHLNGGASGAISKGSIHNIANLFAGTGLTATSSVLSVDASQTQITSIGTIATGTWEGTTIAVDQGGTGLASYTAGDILYATGGTTLAKLAKGTATQVLAMNAGANAPEWVAASGGAGSGNLTTKGDLEAYTSAQTRLGVGANDYVLTADSTAAAGFAWKAGSSYTAGALLDLNGSAFDVDLTEAAAATIAAGDYVIFLDGGTTGTQSKGSVHDVANLFAGTGLTATSSVLSVDASQTQITAVGSIATGVWQGSPIADEYGGTGQTTYAQGDIIYASAADTLTKLPKGADNYVLTMDGNVPVWEAASGGGSVSVTLAGDSGTAEDLSSPVNLTIAGGNAITTVGDNTTTITINHDDTSSVSDVNNSTTYAVQDITFDTYGHVLTVTSADVGGGGGGSGDITGVAFTTDTGSGSKAEDTDGSADFDLLGGLGIGVTNSGAAISVDLDTDLTTVASIYNIGLKVGYGSGDAYIGFDSDNRIQFAIDGTEEIEIDANGRLGIGGPDPTHALTVIGPTIADYAAGAGGVMKLESDSGGDCHIRYDYPDTGGSYWLAGCDSSGATAGSFVIWNSESEDNYIFVIEKGSGKVGIGLGEEVPEEMLTVRGNVSAVGTGYFESIVTAGLFEKNAATDEIADHETGTILVITENGLKPCDKYNDTNVFGVAKSGFKEPLVLGVEPVLVAGIVNVGDFIVTSSKIGHGQRSDEAKHGSVIAQAMESGDGESYIISAMIRKF